ncbi:MAG: 2-amino-4-hydroxy-6-hydroxymethyldihydropteridine diphosphokinase [Elusimicrobia bacterium]|nr:2-amino-4-hydroxy-6-hydroxymethyldihydropteridine diphosphokinase [Elusimicrobiota bacterium]
MTTIYLSLGSNIGNRRKNLEKAVKELEKNNIKKIKISSFYETEPVGPKQRNFYNVAGKFETNLSPQNLLKTVKQIEDKIGRKKTYRWGPRVIDIDILFYGKQIIKSKKLIIPHKEIINRAFVLVPMVEIVPKVVHPIYHKTIKRMFDELKNKKSVRLINCLNS